MTAQNIRTQIVTIQKTEYQNTNDRIQHTEYQNTGCVNARHKISELRSSQYRIQNIRILMTVYRTQNIRIQDVRMWDPKYQNPDRFNTATTEKTEYS